MVPFYVTCHVYLVFAGPPFLAGAPRDPKKGKFIKSTKIFVKHKILKYSEFTNWYSLQHE